MGATVFLPAPPDTTEASHTRRARRVFLLVFAIAVMSMADLHMTLVHAGTIGLAEANPLARYVMQDGARALILWKCGCVALASLIFIAVRHRRTGELGAWICFLTLAALSWQWSRYHAELPTLTAHLHNITHADATWTQLGH